MSVEALSNWVDYEKTKLMQEIAPKYALDVEVVQDLQGIVDYIRDKILPPIFQEMEKGKRKYPDWIEEYGFLQEELEAEFDTDDPDAIDASTLGQYDISDLRAKFDHEWDP